MSDAGNNYDETGGERAEFVQSLISNVDQQEASLREMLALMNWTIIADILDALSVRAAPESGFVIQDRIAATAAIVYLTNFLIQNEPSDCDT